MCIRDRASEGQTTLTNVPILSDVYTMNNVVRGLDIAVDFDEENNTVVVDVYKRQISISANDRSVPTLI